MTGVVVSIRIFSLFIVFVRLTLSAVVESVAFACAQRRGCTAPMCVCLSWREKENDKLMRGVYMPIGHSGFHLHCREQCWRRCGGERSTLFLLCVVVFPEGRWFAVHFFFFDGQVVRPHRRILPLRSSRSHVACILRDWTLCGRRNPSPTLRALLRELTAMSLMRASMHTFVLENAFSYYTAVPERSLMLFR